MVDREMPDPRTPAPRASDAERDSVVARLSTAAGEGRLTLDELADRVDRALAAVTRADLAPLLADLPAEPASGPPAAKGRRRIVGIMGGNDLRVEQASPPPHGAPVRTRGTRAGVLGDGRHRRQGWGPAPSLVHVAREPACRPGDGRVRGASGRIASQRQPRRGGRDARRHAPLTNHPEVTPGGR